VEAWAADLISAKHGRRAVEIAVETLRAILAAAVDGGMIPRNPAARVEFPERPPADRTPADRIVDHNGAARLIAACLSVKHKTIVRAALEAGLRRGEIAGLTWPDVRLEERRRASAGRRGGIRLRGVRQEPALRCASDTPVPFARSSSSAWKPPSLPARSASSTGV
jgi:integrase